MAVQRLGLGLRALGVVGRDRKVAIVEAGDNLYTIAARTLGDGMRWPDIYERNREVIGSNPGLIRPGQVLLIADVAIEPEIETPAAGEPQAERPEAEEPVAAKPAASEPEPAPLDLGPTTATYVVSGGDSLSTIAAKVLGDARRWNEIYALNRALIGSDPGRVFVGQTLTLPGGTPAPVTAPDRTAAPAPAVSEAVGQWWDLAQEMGGRHDVDPKLILAVIQTESQGDPGAGSGAGARGLMQLMPETARSLGVNDPLDPRQNVEGGTKYLRQMLDLFDGDRRLALAAYNAGPGNVLNYGGVPPFEETKLYLDRIDTIMTA